MKTGQKITIVVLIRFSAFSQINMDLGLKINSSSKGRYQLEFRKFFNEKMAFRLALWLPEMNRLEFRIVC